MATKLTVRLLDPDHEVALSLDGTLGTIGAWQSSPDFYTDPNGEEFEDKKYYYVHERDTTTPDAFFDIIPRLYTKPSADPVDPGLPGRDGKDGTLLLSAAIDPMAIGATIGKKDDYFLNTVTGDLYQRQNEAPNNTLGTWQLVGNLRGPRGLQGPAGPPGTGGGTGTGDLDYMPVPPDMANPFSYFDTYPQPTQEQQSYLVTFQTMADLSEKLYDALFDLETRKVNKEPGKGLSKNDFTDLLKQKLEGLQPGTQGPPGIQGPPGQSIVGPPGPPGPAGNGTGTGTLSAFLINSGYTVFTPILLMPRSTGGTYDHSIMEVGLSEWTANVKKSYHITCSNRGASEASGFEATVVCYGNDGIGGSLRAYQNDDGTTTLYIVSPPGFQEISVTYLKTHQATPASTLVFSTANGTPTGTLVYDSRVYKPDLVVGNNLFTRRLNTTNVPLTMLSRNPVTGEFLTSTLDNALAALITNASDLTIQLLCDRLAAINCGGGASTPVVFTAGNHYKLVERFVMGSHFELQDQPNAPLPHDYVVYVQENNCDIVTGYVVDRNYPNVPAAVDIFDGTDLVATITATNTRSDLAGQYGGNPNSLYGFQWVVPASYRVGVARTRSVFARDSATEATYGTSKTTAVCGVPTNQPYPVSSEIVGASTIYEDAAQQIYRVDVLYSDNVKRTWEGPIVWSTDEQTGSYLELESFQDSNRVGLQASNLSSTRRIHLRAAYNNSGTSKEIELVDSVCTRPAGLALQTNLVFNYVKSDNTAATFTTLQDANRTMGRVFNESNIGITGYSDVRAEMANYNIGTDVYLEWASAGVNNCARASTNIYYVLDASKGDTQKRAIYVVDGRIADVLISDYAPPTTQPPTGATPDTRDCISYAKLTNDQSNALPSITTYEYYDRNTPNGSLSYTVRGFTSVDEALTYMKSFDPNGALYPRANFEFNKCTSDAARIGDILYNDNRPEHVASADNFSWPIEAGYWGFNYVPPTQTETGSFVVLRTNACGQIISRQVVSLPATGSSQPTTVVQFDYEQVNEPDANNPNRKSQAYYAKLSKLGEVVERRLATKQNPGDAYSNYSQWADMTTYADGGFNGRGSLINTRGLYVRYEVRPKNNPSAVVSIEILPSLDVVPRTKLYPV